MTRRSRIHVITIAASVAAAASVVLAQSDRINIPRAPRPGQTARMTMNQDMDMNVAFEGAPATAGLGPMKMTMRTSMEMTQKTGEPRADGTYDAEVTYSQIRAVVEMNGQPVPTAAAQNQMEGQTITVTYNAGGQIVDVKGLPGAAAMTDAIGKMMSSFSGNLPTTIAVGETVTTPLSFAFPLPIPGGAPVTMVGETKMTLVSVDAAAGGRVARFESTSDGKMAGQGPGVAGAGMTLDFTIAGAGTTVYDLEKGMLRSSETRSTFSGKMTPSGAATPVPAMSIQGTVNLTVVGN